MKIGKEQLGMFAVAAVLFVGIAFLAWTQRPGADDNNASAGTASDDISDLRLGMIDLHSPNPGQLAPDFVLEDAQGNRVRLSDFRGTPVFLNFWATWCPFCIEEMPDMQLIQDQFGDQLVVLGVNNGETASVGQPYATDRVGVSYRLVYDPDERVVNGYNIPRYADELLHRRQRDHPRVPVRLPDPGTDAGEGSGRDGRGPGSAVTSICPPDSMILLSS